MAIDIRNGAHTFGDIANKKECTEKEVGDREAFDIGGTAIVALHQKSRILFISGKAEVDLFASADQIWIWGGILRLHTKCTVRQSGGIVFANGTGSLLIVTKGGITHASPGDRVFGFHEAQIHADADTDVNLRGYALQHLPDGTVRGNTDSYRPGYCLHNL